MKTPANPKSLFFAVATIVSMLVMLGSCLKSTKPGLPDEVVQAINETGFNRIQLTKTISNFLDPADSLQREAAYFLIGNMQRQYSLDYKLTDSLDNEFTYNPLTICEADSFLLFWQKMEDQKGPINYKSEKFTLDRDTITSELLTETILQTLNTQTLPWTQSYTKEQVFSFVLPYRVANEHIDNWRSFLHGYFLHKIPSDIHKNPDAVAHFLNDYINTLFKFDIRFIKQAQIQSVEELFQTRSGNYQDLSVLKVKALRSMGIPASLDYIPYFADSLYSFYFAAFINAQGSFEMLPNKGHAQLFSKEKNIPKIYRRIYEELDTGLFAQKDIRLTTPPFLGHYHYLDVTSNYIQVHEVHFRGSCPDSILYLTVFNDKKWRAVDWAVCKINQARFLNVGAHVHFQFAVLKDSVEQLTPVSSNFQDAE